LTFLTPLDLSLAAVFVISLAIVSRLSQLGIGNISALRTTLQLLLVGLVLNSLFSHAKPIWVGLMAFVMLCVATREVVARQKNPLKGAWGFGIGSLSMFISSFVITSLALIVIINRVPWYTPRYAIPLLGMILGNTMNGIAIGMDRLTQTARDQKKTIEARLMMGQTWLEAISDIRRDRTGFGSIFAVSFTAKRLFDSRHRLCLDRLK